MGYTITDTTGSPPGEHPKGILKNSSLTSPPVSPTSPDQPLSAKEVTIANTHYNAGNRRTPSNSSRRASSLTPSTSGQELESSQRLKWDEANLYLTEQERTPKMKIDEPKTPWATGHGALDDISDGEDGPGGIPGLELGEPERKVPERRLSDGSQKVVHVDDTAVSDKDVDMEDMSAEEKEKHEKFEKMRRSHYEMRTAVQLLGHTEELMDEDEDDGEDGNKRPGSVQPPMPSIPQNLPNTNGSS